ncbi:hypothetical protein RDV84_23485 [Lysobacter yananisis]|jgi:hypothetical protein|uniref:Uncharacterized protein n=1 Tax=Lysobacter yananisis TaxID=1003114 RepID=A0ABY9P747_9GAMM|nr:hypothetical protein [Lysobacter yananisis]WMT02888.1 hypothetical protein RDV84_23485 [Lysobacter yananisis]
MKADAATRRWRIASWLAAAASLALPVAAYLLQKRELDAAMHTHHGYVCGLPYLAAMLSSVLFAAVLSLAAMLCSWRAWRRLPPPRSIARTLEVAAVGIALWLLLLLAGAISALY